MKVPTRKFGDKYLANLAIIDKVLVTIENKFRFYNKNRLKKSKAKTTFVRV